jgi:hypothetical protein
MIPILTLIRGETLPFLRPVKDGNQVTSYIEEMNKCAPVIKLQVISYHFERREGTRGNRIRIVRVNTWSSTWHLK